MLRSCLKTSKEFQAEQKNCLLIQRESFFQVLLNDERISKMNETLDDHLLENTSPKRKPSQWFYFFLVVLLLGSLLSTILAWRDVENIIYYGPVMSVIGVIFSFLARGIKNQRAFLLGIVPLLVSTLLLLIIYFQDYSPSDCQFWVPVFLSTVVVGMLISGITIFTAK